LLKLHSPWISSITAYAQLGECRQYLIGVRLQLGSRGDVPLFDRHGVSIGERLPDDAARVPVHRFEAVQETAARITSVPPKCGRGLQG
jgi:hypothetical protein